jgi:hypothetical protein
VANNYTEFSEVIENLTSEEAEWLRHQLVVVCRYGDVTLEEDDIPAEREHDTPDWEGCRIYLTMEDYDRDYGEDAGFEYVISQPDDVAPVSMWIYSEESGNTDRVAHVIQMFLKQFRPDDHWSMSWAYTCSKPRISEFGGGAMFVTATDIKTYDTGQFVETCEKAVKKAQESQDGP